MHAGGGNLLETWEAKDGIVLLRFLAHPGDDLALVAALRSPFFAVDDGLLHGLAREREKGGRRRWVLRTGSGKAGAQRAAPGGVQE